MAKVRLAASVVQIFPSGDAHRLDQKVQLGSYPVQHGPRISDAQFDVPNIWRPDYVNAGVTKFDLPSILCPRGASFGANMDQYCDTSSSGYTSSYRDIGFGIVIGATLIILLSLVGGVNTKKETCKCRNWPSRPSRPSRRSQIGETVTVFGSVYASPLCSLDKLEIHQDGPHCVVPRLAYTKDEYDELAEKLVALYQKHPAKTYEELRDKYINLYRPKSLKGPYVWFDEMMLGVVSTVTDTDLIHLIIGGIMYFETAKPFAEIIVQRKLYSAAAYWERTTHLGFEIGREPLREILKYSRNHFVNIGIMESLTRRGQSTDLKEFVLSYNEGFGDSIDASWDVKRALLQAEIVPDEFYVEFSLHHPGRLRNYLLSWSIKDGIIVQRQHCDRSSECREQVMCEHQWRIMAPHIQGNFQFLRLAWNMDAPTDIISILINGYMVQVGDTEYDLGYESDLGFESD